METKILIADAMHPSLFLLLEKAGFVYDYEPDIQRATLYETIQHYEGLMIRSKTFLDEAFFEKAPKLRFIARAGAGLDLIDLKAAKKHHVKVFAANEGNRDAVGEHCVGMLLCLFNKIHQADAEVRKGLWRREANRGIELMGKTVGIIGYGNMGTSLAQRLSGFGVTVLAYDKYLKNYGDAYAQESTMDEIFREADVLSLHVPLTDETYQLVNEEYLQQFRKKIYLVNSSRGEVVVLRDLVNALQAGHVRGACLDVLENEKLNALTSEQSLIYQQLFELPHVVLTPHVAGWTEESYLKINEVLVEKITQYARA
ncbi:MAG: 2-hydroxyacid dehydrogenase [Spirosomataceae bacterium]